MKRIKVTIHWRSGLDPAQYYFDTWNSCFVWLCDYWYLYHEDIAKVTVKRKGIESESDKFEQFIKDNPALADSINENRVK